MTNMNNLYAIIIIHYNETYIIKLILIRGVRVLKT